MAFTPQNNDGTVEGANAYHDVAYLRAYALDRGIDLTAAGDPALQVAIVKATDYLDAAFSFVGHRLYRLQGTEWPRGQLTDYWLRGLPQPLLEACCSLAIRANAGKVLMPDPTFDPSGQVVSELSVKVGPIEKSTKFAQGTGGTSSRAFLPKYPDVEMALRSAGLIGGGTGGQLSRG